MLINIEIKNKGAEKITDIVGLTEDEVANFITEVAFNGTPGITEAIMAESDTENFGQILLALTSMHINDRIRKFTDRIEEFLNEDEDG